MNGTLLKGLGLGVVAGVLLTVSVVPMDRKRIMRSGTGKAIKAIGHVVEGISGGFC